jgi:hypothetical protein
MFLLQAPRALIVPQPGVLAFNIAKLTREDVTLTMMFYRDGSAGAPLSLPLFEGAAYVFLIEKAFPK